MSPFIKKKISYQSQSRTNSLQFTDEQVKQDWFNDVTIEVENHLIPANKMILSCYSDYFKNMFSTPMKEQYERSVKLIGLDKGTMKLIIDYIYNGSIDIDDENVINLLFTADYLQLEQVKQFCFEFLESILTTESCFEILAAADLYRDDSLKKKVYQFISLNLDQIIKTESFKNLSKSALVSCISNLKRGLAKETSIYHATIAWVNEDKNVRENKFSELFQIIELNRLSTEFLACVISEEHLVQKHLVCLNLTLKAIVHKSCQTFFNKKSPAILVLFRVFDGTLKIHEFLPSQDFASQNLEKTPLNFPDLPKNGCGQIFKLNDFVFCCTKSTIWKIKLTDQNETWQEVCINTNLGKLFLYKSVLVNFDVYGNATYLDLTSLHSPKWENLALFNRHRSFATIVFCDGYLYVLGGSDTSASSVGSLKCVQRVSGFTLKWQELASMKTGRTKFTAVSYKQYIFALGGYDVTNNEWLKSVEKFNSIELTWTFVKPMINERTNHTACVVENKIFVAGGYNQRGYVKDVECYDILRDEWNAVQRLDPDFHRILSICS